MIFKVFAGGAGKSRQVLEFLHFGALLRDILIKGLEPARAGKFCKTYQIISNSIFRIAPGHPYTFLTLTFTTCSETLVFEPGDPALDSRGEQTWMPSCCAHNAYDSSKTGDAGGALATALATSSAGSSGNKTMAAACAIWREGRAACGQPQPAADAERCSKAIVSNQLGEGFDRGQSPAKTLRRIVKVNNPQMLTI